eukprot:TRINITY_DN4364_c1_g1_i2.p1 TRINITY_DN4364_c1_g1~~TRINITY_DN4364_c1_g1_i2.p1  ORF type:complete len:218 (-),score=52.57 TRINITY_DN4364_c1_g1_i2:142-768(-)
MEGASSLNAQASYLVSLLLAAAPVTTPKKEPSVATQDRQKRQKIEHTNDATGVLPQTPISEISRALLRDIQSAPTTPRTPLALTITATLSPTSATPSQQPSPQKKSQHSTSSAPTTPASKKRSFAAFAGHISTVTESPYARLVCGKCKIEQDKNQYSQKQIRRREKRKCNKCTTFQFPCQREKKGKHLAIQEELMKNKNTTNPGDRFV